MMVGGLRRVLVGVSVAGAGASVVWANGDEGTRRSARLWWVAGPVVARYRLTELRHKRGLDPDAAIAPKFLKRPENDEVAAAEWDRLDRTHSDDIVRLIMDLKGMYTKYGQTAAGLSNTLSATWMEKLRVLEDKVPPQSVEVVKQTIRADFGRDADEIFASFDPEPLGSASIGQVHRAVLARDGQEVAVKVQYPDSERLFRSDMRAIRYFFEVVAPEQVPILGELERSFENEFNYEVEANNLLLVDANMREAGFCPSQVLVPRPIEDLCTRRVLTMELLKGPKLVDGLREYGTKIARERGITFEQLEQEMRYKFEKEGVPAHYKGPSARAVDAYKSWLLLRNKVTNTGIAVVNSLFLKPIRVVLKGGGLVANRVGIPGNKIELAIQALSPVPYREPELPPLNAPRIMKTIMEVHGHQMLVNGAFQCDPHAGNFLLLPDGRVGLIDYGATKHLTRAERLSACILYIALHRRDQAMITRAVTIGGYKSKYNNMDVVYRTVRFCFDTFGNDLLQGKNVQEFIDDCYREDPWEETPENLTMGQFLSIRLRSLAMAMNYPVVCSDTWGPIANRALELEGLSYNTLTEQELQDIFGQATLSKGATFF